MKLIITLAVVLLCWITVGKALECFSHSICSVNCPQLSNTITTCTDNQDRCYKVAFPGGVSRGCARDQCNVQINANGIMAYVCCETDLCNSANTLKVAISALFMVVGVTLLVYT